MTRTIDLPDEQVTALERYCEREHVSPQEALSRAVNALVTSAPMKRESAVAKAQHSPQTAGSAADQYPEPAEGEMVDPELEAALRGAFGIWRNRDAVPDLASETDECPTFPLSPAAMKAFGSWKHKDIDSVEYVRALRAEWDRPWDPD